MPNNSKPLLIIPELACAVGLNESIVLRQVHYWSLINKKSNKNFYDGRFWVYSTYLEWEKQFPFWSISTIKRIFKSLEDQGLLLSANYNKLKIDRTKWYAIEYTALPCGILCDTNYDTNCNTNSEISSSTQVALCQIDTMNSSNLTQPLPETIKEINNNTQNNAQNNASKKHFEGDNSTINFIAWYKDLYYKITHKAHPYLKDEQYSRVHDTIRDFSLEYGIDVSHLEDMADAYFKEVKSDHNINHFATEGILKIRKTRLFGE